MVREQGDVTGVNIINPQAPGGLGAMCSWSSSINSSFRPLGVILAPVKQLRKCASDTIIWVLQRGAKAEGLGEGSVQGRPQRVLLGYTPASQAAFLTCQNSQI